MVRVSQWCMAGGLSLVAFAGCNRSEEPVSNPPLSWTQVQEECSIADDCDDLFGGSTVRQHSEQSATYAELSVGCPYAPEDVPAPEALVDQTVPEFNARRGRASNMHRWEESLQDIDLHQHMMGLQGTIFGCVDLAACYEDGADLPGAGDLDFDFELEPNGRVAAVSVEVSPGLDHPSVVACARQAMFEYRFPSYDGGQMMVEYTMTIEEVDAEA